MKKILIFGSVFCAMLLVSSCGTSKESAYRKAYEKAKAQEMAQTQGQVPYESTQYQQQQQYVQQDPAQYQQQTVQQQPQYVQQQPVQQQPQYVQQQPVQQSVQQPQQYVQQQPVQQQTQPVQQQPQYVQQTVTSQSNVTQVQGSGLRNFSVVVSASGNSANAENLAQTLRNAGYGNAQVVPNGNLFRVIASTYDDRNEAEKDKVALSSKYPGTWIMAK